MCLKKNKYYTFRIYPDKEQEVLFAKTFGSTRLIYNLMLSEALENKSLGLGYIYRTPAKFKSEYTFLGEVDSLALANAQMNLKSAFSNRRKNIKHFSIPKFKSKKNSSNSYTTNFVNDNISLSRGFIKLPKVGKVKIIQHREIPNEYTLKSATIKKSATNKYTVSVLFEYYESIEELSLDEGRVLGLDMALDSLFVDSNGNTPEGQNKHFKEMQNRLAKEQRKLSKRMLIAKKQGKSLADAKNYQKQRLIVAKLQEDIANKRKDFLHKTSHLITKDYDFIMIEDLNIKAISRGLRLGKSVHDNSWTSFILMLDYKLSDKGGQLVKIGKSYPSSKMCSGCNDVKKTLLLSERTYNCHSCGLSMDRDHNAALNVKKEGLRIALQV